MRVQQVSFASKLKVWLFSQIAWRLVYRWPQSRRLLHRGLQRFFRETKTRQILGQKLQINPNRSVLEMKLWTTSMYEPEVVEYLSRRLQPGMVFVDVGANLGLFSLFAADLVGNVGKVIAYEPDPCTYAELRANIALNGHTNIIAEQIAISNARGTLGLNVSGERDLNTIAPSAGGECIKVQADTLDSSLQKFDLERCDVIKMDIEGGEWFAMQGLWKTIAQHQNVELLIEMHNPQIRALGGSPEEILQSLLNSGFRLYELNMWRGLTQLQSSAQTRIHGHLLCSRAPQAARRTRRV